MAGWNCLALLQLLICGNYDRITRETAVVQFRY